MCRAGGGDQLAGAQAGERPTGDTRPVPRILPPIGPSRSHEPPEGHAHQASRIAARCRLSSRCRDAREGEMGARRCEPRGWLVSFAPSFHRSGAVCAAWLTAHSKDRIEPAPHVFAESICLHAPALRILARSNA